MHYWQLFVFPSSRFQTYPFNDEKRAYPEVAFEPPQNPQLFSVHSVKEVPLFLLLSSFSKLLCKSVAARASFFSSVGKRWDRKCIFSAQAINLLKCSWPDILLVPLIDGRGRKRKWFYLQQGRTKLLPSFAFFFVLVEKCSVAQRAPSLTLSPLLLWLLSSFS